MELRNVQSLDKPVGIFKIFVRLAACANDDIHTDESIWHHFLHLADFVCEERRVVASVHEAQHVVGTALERNVEVWHESPRLRTIFNDFVRQQIRFDARNAVALNAFNMVERFDEVEKRLLRRASEVATASACATSEAMDPLRERPRAMGMVQ